MVAIFTKFDDLIVQEYDTNKEHEENRQVACATLETKFERPLKGYKFPPRAYVRFEGMSLPLWEQILGLIAGPAIDKDEGNHQEQVVELIKQTAASIDSLALKMLFVTVQQNNLEVCIEYAVNRSVVHSSTGASTDLYFRDIFNHTSTVVHFCVNCRDMSTQMNTEGIDCQGRVLVWTYLSSGM